MSLLGREVIYSEVRSHTRATSSPESLTHANIALSPPSTRMRDCDHRDHGRPGGRSCGFDESQLSLSALLLSCPTPPQPVYSRGGRSALCRLPRTTHPACAQVFL